MLHSNRSRSPYEDGTKPVTVQCPVSKLQQQPGLAHPSLAGQQHQPRAALLGPLQRRRKPVKLIGPADERLARKPPTHAASMAAPSEDGNGSAMRANLSNFECRGPPRSPTQHELPLATRCLAQAMLVNQASAQ